MLKRTLMLAVAALLAAAPVSATVDGPVPAALRKFRPYQIVEQVMAQREMLNLSERQFAALDDLAQSIRTEKHTWMHRGGKPHRARHVTMMSRQAAFDQALELLSPDQQARLFALYPAPIEEPARRLLRQRAPGKP